MKYTRRLLSLLLVLVMVLGMIPAATAAPAEQAAEAGVEVHGLSAYCRGDCPRPSTLVLGYAGMSEEELREAAERLRRAFITPSK